MDPVSAAALSWLTGQAAASGAKGLKHLLLGDQHAVLAGLLAFDSVWSLFASGRKKAPSQDLALHEGWAHINPSASA